jgi:hypothetical protein
MTRTEKARARFAALFAAVGARLGASRVERTVSILMGIAVLAGLAFRARGYLFEASAFWLDECVWAMNLTTRPLTQNLIRPPGFIIISKGLAVTLGPTETVLRALPWIAGVVATIAAPALARRLYQSLTSRLLFVAIIALNPAAIDFSKEFKPYSIGLLLHFSLILLALRYVETRRGRDLGLVLAVAALGGLFTQDLVFAFPGLFAVLGWDTFRQAFRPGRLATEPSVPEARLRSHFYWVVAVAGVIVALLLAQYFFLWRHLPKDSSEYWGNKYNVFYTGKGARNYLAWAFERYRDMTGLPGIRREYWQDGGMDFEHRQMFRQADRVLWLTLHLMGLMVMVWRKRWREALLVALPLYVLWAFNALGFWPFGMFRTNVFTVVYTTAIAAMAFDVPSDHKLRWFAPIPALVIVLAPMIVFEGVWHSRKQAFTYDSKIPQLIDRLVRIGEGTDGKAPLILDRRSCDPWRFYTQFHPATRARYAELVAENYDAHCLRNDTLIPSELQKYATTRQAVWIVLHVGHGLDKMVRTGKFAGLYRISRFEVGPHTVMSFRRRAPRPPAGEQPLTAP